MMEAYLVTLKQPGNVERYIDSLWVEESSAQKRVNQLYAEFSRLGKQIEGDGINRIYVWKSAIVIQDGRLKPPVPAKQKVTVTP